jgi:PAS domain S-box-containing protein
MSTLFDQQGPVAETAQDAVTANDMRPNALTEADAADHARIGLELTRPHGGTDPFAASVRATHMPMIVTDPALPDNPVVFANDAFCRLTGYARAEIVGRNCRFLQGPGSDPQSIARIRAAVAAGQPLEIELCNYRKTGEPFWNRLMMAPVRDDAGRIVYFVASQVDVTLARDRLVGLENQNATLTAELADRLRAQQDSEGQLRFATKAGGLGVWELDPWSRVLSSSPTARAHFGFEPGQVLTTATVLAAVIPEDRERLATSFRTVFDTGAAANDFAGEYGVLRPDGSIGWIDLRAQLVCDPTGAPLRLAGTSLDVTERHLAAARLALSEAHLRLATEAAEIGTWDVDMTTNVMVWSDRTKAMFGYPPDATCTMEDFYGGLHPEDFAATQAAFAAALDPAQRVTYDVEYRTIGRHDGVVRWVAAKGRGLFEDDRCIRAMGTAIDITRRKTAEARQAMLLALASRLRTLTDPRAITQEALDALGRQLGVNRVGYSQVQADDATIILDTGYADGVAPLTGAFTLDQFGPGNIASQRRGELLVLSDVLTDPTQADVDWMSVETRAVVSVPLIRGGRFRASLFVNCNVPRDWPPEEIALIQDVAAMIWDAVERARAEEALRELNANLEARVEERTAALLQAEDALRQAQKMEAVGQLTGGIAHDFNNLLTGIVGSLELLQRRVADGRTGDLARYANVAMDSAQRAAALTQRLLAFARRQPLDPRPVDVTGLLEGIEDLLRRTLGPAITLELAPDPALWPALCDPNQLESAILNLAINARDAMADATADAGDQAAGRLLIRTSNRVFDEAYASAQGGELRPGDYVMLSVADTGTGMTPDVMERAFEPFFTTKPLGQGTGLGLSMLYGFIKQSQGHVAIQSAVGQGTEFRVFLPRAAG